jgi:rod shape-determining protein MreD
MNEIDSKLLLARRQRSLSSRLRVVLGLCVPLAAILFQVYVPLFFSFLTFLELPLLVTVYYSLMHRQPLWGIFYGAGIGLLQDSLSHNPLGMFGIVKTLVGFFAASVSLRVEVENVLVRFLLSFFFFLFHQFCYWTMANGLLGQQFDFAAVQALVFGFLNAAVAVPLFRVLDKL